jgi:hypothetical protein
MKESDMRLAENITPSKAMPTASRAIDKEDGFPSRVKEPSSYDWDAPGDLRVSLVQRDYTLKQKLVVLTLIMVLIVISLFAFYLLWAKASGTP